MKFKVGDRVVAKNDLNVGKDFRGLRGTVGKINNRSTKTEYLVAFDDPPERDNDRPFQGGIWHNDSLELDVVPEEDIQKAIRSILGET